MDFNSEGQTVNVYPFNTTITNITMVATGYVTGNLSDHIVVKETTGLENTKNLTLIIKTVRHMFSRFTGLSILNKIHFQYPLIINATTNDNVELTGYEVFINGSATKAVFESDNKTTVSTYDFNTKLDIVAKKIGHQDANETNYMIKDLENIIDLNLPKNRVIYCFF